MLQSCSGQITRQPVTMPCDSGPPRCGHRSSSAKTRSSRVRNTATSQPKILTARAPSRGIASSGPTSTQSACTCCFAAAGSAVSEPRAAMSADLLQGHELRRRRFRGPAAGFPRVGLRVPLRLDEARAQLVAALRVLDDALLHVVEADALDPVRRALEIERFLAVELQKGAAVHLDVVGRRHAAQHVRAAQPDAAVAADVQLVAGFEAD